LKKWIAYSMPSFNTRGRKRSVARQVFNGASGTPDALARNGQGPKTG
jgi:hypothetical protein